MQTARSYVLCMLPHVVESRLCRAQRMVLAGRIVVSVMVTQLNGKCAKAQH